MRERKNLSHDTSPLYGWQFSKNTKVTIAHQNVLFQIEVTEILHPVSLETRARVVVRVSPKPPSRYGIYERIINEAIPVYISYYQTYVYFLLGI